MSKGQKRALAVMTLVMVLVLGAVVLTVVQSKLNDSRAAYQLELSGLQREYDLKATNIAVNH